MTPGPADPPRQDFAADFGVGPSFSRVATDRSWVSVTRRDDFTNLGLALFSGLLLGGKPCLKLRINRHGRWWGRFCLGCTDREEER